MIVQDNRNEESKLRFKDLKKGSFFSYRGRIFLKLDADYFFKNSTGNCLDCEEDCLSYVCEDDEIISLNVKVIIEG